MIPCSECQGEGVSRGRECVSCGGNGNQTCENRGCDEIAIAFNDDGKALCEDCLMEWQIAEFGQ